MQRRARQAAARFGGSRLGDLLARLTELKGWTHESRVCCCRHLYRDVGITTWSLHLEVRRRDATYQYIIEQVDTN